MARRSEADWPLHSSLYRRLLLTSVAASAPDEAALLRIEKDVLRNVHQWGLHHGDRGRMSILRQLATLQHFGAPTRLIDVSLNAFIGLWFAVEQKFENGELVNELDDGRLFAVDISSRRINEDEIHRPWEDDLSRPWKALSAREWSTAIWAWRPPPFEPRIASQHGAFLLGGVPSAVAPPGIQGPLQWPKTTAPTPRWRIDEVRRCTSIPLRMHKVDPAAGGVGEAGQPAFTFRIEARAKPEIRIRLREMFGYSHATIYPDFPGFSQFAESIQALKSRA